MSLVTNVDLLRAEPEVFLDASSAAMVRAAAVDAAISGLVLSSASSNFVAAGIAKTDVVVAAAQILEIDEVVSTTNLRVTRPRGSGDVPMVAPEPGENLDMKVLSMAHLIEHVEAWTLGALGLDPEDPAHHGEPPAILNTAEMRKFIVLRSIGLAFSRAAARAPDDDALRDRATLYASRAGRARDRLLVRIDRTGDGGPDGTRRLGLVRFRRN